MMLPTATRRGRVTKLEKLRKAKDEVVRELDRQESARIALLRHLRWLEEQIAAAASGPAPRG